MKNGSDIENKYCCGCGLCNHFSEGFFNEKGYFRPNFSSENTKFDKSICYCNCLNDIKPNNIWGSIVQAYLGYSKNDIIRKKASSGGILTELTKYLLDSDKVDYVISVKSSEKSLIKTETVWQESSKEAILYSGSKYTASSSLIDLLENVDINKRYAVIGKPCDIRVLRMYIQKNIEYQKVFPYLLSFFCGGTPSYQANKKLLSKMGLEEENLRYFSYRGNGWPGKTTGINNKGYKSEVAYEESWGQVLGRDLQEICRFCWEGVGEAADISCGDGWNLVDGKPSFEEDEGRNIIFARNEKGNNLLKEMSSKGLIYLEPIEDLTILNQMQPGQFTRKAAMFSMVLAMKIMRKSVPNYKIKQLFSYARLLSIGDNIKMFGGVVKRIFSGKIK